MAWVSGAGGRRANKNVYKGAGGDAQSQWPAANPELFGGLERRLDALPPPEDDGADPEALLAQVEQMGAPSKKAKPKKKGRGGKAPAAPSRNDADHLGLASPYPEGGSRCSPGARARWAARRVAAAAAARPPALACGECGKPLRFLMQLCPRPELPHAYRSLALPCCGGACLRKAARALRSTARGDAALTADASGGGYRSRPPGRRRCRRRPLPLPELLLTIDMEGDWKSGPDADADDELSKADVLLKRYRDEEAALGASGAAEPSAEEAAAAWGDDDGDDGGGGGSRRRGDARLRRVLLARARARHDFEASLMRSPTAWPRAPEADLMREHLRAAAAQRWGDGRRGGGRRRRPPSRLPAARERASRAGRALPPRPRRFAAAARRPRPRAAGAAVPACGAPRWFEFQILPQLLGAIEPEADGGGGDGAATGNPLAPSAGSLDWGTACVYTCSASCAGADGGEYAEEYVWHQAL